jgi:hypothetical protein
MIILLNQATDIINLWQQSGGNLTTQWNWWLVFLGRGIGVCFAVCYCA